MLVPEPICEKSPVPEIAVEIVLVLDRLNAMIPLSIIATEPCVPVAPPAPTWTVVPAAMFHVACDTIDLL